jgi:hypothetical protein
VVDEKTHGLDNLDGDVQTDRNDVLEDDETRAGQPLEELITSASASTSYATAEGGGERTQR